MQQFETFSVKVNPKEFCEGPPESLHISADDWRELVKAGCTEFSVGGYKNAAHVNALFSMQPLGVGAHAPSLKLTARADGIIQAYFIHFAEHATGLPNPESCVRPAVWRAMRSWAETIRQDGKSGDALVMPPYPRTS